MKEENTRNAYEVPDGCFIMIAVEFIVLSGKAENAIVMIFTGPCSSIDLIPEDLLKSLFEEFIPVEMPGAKTSVTKLRSNLLGCLSKQGEQLAIPRRLPQQVNVTMFVNPSVREAWSIGYSSSFEALNGVLVCTILCKDSIYPLNTKGCLEKVASKGLHENEMRILL